MGRKSKYSQELLEPIVASSFSYTEVARKLGIEQWAGNIGNIKKRIEALNISTSHFTGRSWSRNLTANDHPGLAKMRTSLSYKDEEVFVENSTYPTHKLTKRLIRMGWNYRCSICSIDSWLNEPLTLHLDHINGVANDHQLDNLRWLCPNCHQQTTTWGGKNARRKRDRSTIRNQCVDCGKGVKPTSTRCVSCANRKKAIGKDKISWPPIASLAEQVNRSSYAAVARELGVSGNAVKNRIKKLANQYQC